MTAQPETAPNRRRGQPSAIDKIIGHDETTGEAITVAQAIVTQMARGDYLEKAAAFCGVDKHSIYQWGHVAARAKIRTQGDIDHESITDHERACIHFSHAVDAATAQAHARALDTLQLLAAGGIPQITTTITVNAKGDTETSTKTTHTLPSETAVRWWLERRFPDLYGQRVEIAHGPALDRDDHAAALLEAARESHARREPATPRSHSPKKRVAKKS